MTFGEILKKYRIEKNLSQKELGDLCGMADSAIRRYENSGSNPTFKTVKKLAAALEIEPSELLVQREMNAGNSSDDPGEAELLNSYRDLSDTGKSEARKRVSELTRLKEYVD